ITLNTRAYNETRELDSRRLIDIAADGTVLQVELLDVSDGVDLTDLPEADAIAAALERAGIRTVQSTPAE
ncbi:MAG TPA: hypothetical protein VGW38_11380, partial [Chloroflexota bacterium]|nr:hypothetical protein [Chloroflexota bacterium]